MSQRLDSIARSTVLTLSNDEKMIVEGEHTIYHPAQATKGVTDLLQLQNYEIGHTPLIPAMGKFRSSLPER